MSRLLFVIKKNIKKQKGDMITFAVLMFIVSMLLYASISSVAGVGNVLDTLHEKINGSDVEAIFDKPKNSDEDEDYNKFCKEIENFIENDDDYVKIEKDSLMDLTVEYKKEGNKEYSNSEFFMASFDKKREISNVELPGNLNDDDILLPYNMSGDYKKGDKIKFKFENKEFTFNVAGFIEDPLYATTLNIMVYYVFVSDRAYEEINEVIKDETICFDAYVYRMKTKEDVKLSGKDKELDSKIRDLFTQFRGENPQKEVVSSFIIANFDDMKGGGSFMSMVVMMLICMVAVLTLIVSLVMIGFSIRNFINRDIKNTSILEACGYTVSELRRYCIIQNVLVAGTGSLLGIIVAMLLNKVIGNVVSLTLGLRWNQDINILIGVVLLLTMILVIVFVSFIISKTYNKVTVVEGLRGGIKNHNFKKDRYPLDKGNMPLPISLSIKETFRSPKRSIAMFFIMMLLTAEIGIGFGLYENYGTDTDKILKLAGMEGADAFIIGDATLNNELEKLDSVESVISGYGITYQVEYKDKASSAYCNMYQDFDKLKNVSIVEGRVPKQDNEIVIGSKTKEDLGVDVGDMITVIYGSKKAEYMVCGIEQRINMMGRTGLMTVKGSERITYKVNQQNHYLIAKEGKTFADIEKDVKDKYPDLSVADYTKNIDSILSIIKIAMKAICIVIVIIMIIVVFIIETLVIRNKINREWKNIGINKALGLTSKEAFIQIAISNMPVIIAGALIGALISNFLGKVIMTLCLSLFAMRKLSFSVSLLFMLISIIIILIIAFFTALLSGLKIRKIDAVEMLSGE